MSATLRMVRNAILTASVLGLASAGCAIDQAEGVEGDENLGRIESATEISNTSSINGRNLNGRNLNGKNLTGITLNGSNITAFIDKNKKLSGAALVGAEIDGELDDATPVVLRIDAVEQYASPHKGSAVFAYTIAFKTPDMNTWGHVCGSQQNAPLRAIPLQGKWNYGEGVEGGGSRIEDPDAITFACDGGALYKCVAIGYEPWITVKGASLKDHHQACTRMIRADYCGDGQSWTKDGTLINIYDNLGIQADTEEWPHEAEWDPHGARCLSHQRLQSNQHQMPACAFQLPAATCGVEPQWGSTLLVSEYVELSSGVGTESEARVGGASAGEH